MNSELGLFVRELRTARQLSLSALARLAGVNKATLSRWESGQQAPRLPELAAVLTASGATAAQQRKAVLLLDAPRGVRQVRAYAQQSKNAFLQTMGRVPCGGDLLRAMRLRQRRGLEEVARAVGVQASTISRWERGEVWPSTQSLHLLCRVLGAHEAEIIALTLGTFRRGDADTAAAHSPEILEERLFVIFHGTLDPQVEQLKDLLFLDLEAKIWPLAVRQPSVRPLLTSLYSLRANNLASQQRWTEIQRYADRAIELVTQERVPMEFAFHAAMAAAQAAVHRGPRPAPTRGIALVRPWIDCPGRPGLRAWARSNLGNYLSLSGKMDEAICLAQEACTVAEQDGNRTEIMLRKMDLARMYLDAGAPTHALATLPTQMPSAVQNLGRLLLLHAEASYAVADTSAAHVSLQQTYKLLDQTPIEPLRQQANALATRL